MLGKETFYRFAYAIFCWLTMLVPEAFAASCCVKSNRRILQFVESNEVAFDPRGLVVVRRPRYFLNNKIISAVGRNSPCKVRIRFVAGLAYVLAPPLAGAFTGLADVHFSGWNTGNSINCVHQNPALKGEGTP